MDHSTRVFELADAEWAAVARAADHAQREAGERLARRLRREWDPDAGTHAPVHDYEPMELASLFSLHALAQRLRDQAPASNDDPRTLRIHPNEAGAVVQMLHAAAQPEAVEANVERAIQDLSPDGLTPEQLAAARNHLRQSTHQLPWRALARRLEE